MNAASAGRDPARFEWIFKAPEAELFDKAGKRIGKHYAGPTWESDDGNKAVGAAKRATMVRPQRDSWLLLTATSAKGNSILARRKASSW
jgi:hypothetical protein